MKKSILFAVTLIISTQLFAQLVIDDPKVGFSLAPGIQVTKLELSDTATVLHFLAKQRAGSSISIPPQSYIMPVGGDTLYIKSTIDIPMGKWFSIPASGEARYQLVFPPIDKKVTKINYGEANDGGSWFIYDIYTTNIAIEPKLPSEFMGSWYDKADGSLAVLLLDTCALYNKALWSYSSVDLAKKKANIILTKGTEKVSLSIELHKNGECSIGMQGEALKVCVDGDQTSRLADSTSDQPFENPFFKMDTAIYSGIVMNYSPRFGYKTFSLYVNNMLEGQQKKYVVTMKEDGSFTFKLPLIHPSVIYVNAPFANANVYLEPGAELFHLINTANTDNSIFTGQAAAINIELGKAASIPSYNYNEAEGLILDMSAEDYKSYCLENQSKDLLKLEEKVNNGEISKKCAAVKRYDVLCTYAANMIMYPQFFKSTYARKNKLDPREPFPFEVPNPALTYYDFLSDELMDNPHIVATSNAYMLLNYLNYITSILNMTKEIGVEEIAEELRNEGYEFTPVEQALLEKTAAVKANDSTSDNLVGEYGDYDSLAGKFLSSHKATLRNLIIKSGIEARNQFLIDSLGLKNGFIFDILQSQNACASIVDEMVPATDEELSLLKSKFSNPFFYEYIVASNEAIKKQIALNSTKTGYIVNDVSKTEADILFDSIISKYNGKVVYVDFWATWCGPCQSGISNIKPLKEEMANENVAFVYITNQSSPENKWANQIPDIKGEHYRLSTDQWNYLSAKFNIVGIPHYILVDKEGQIVNPNVGFKNNIALRKLIEQYL